MTSYRLILAKTLIGKLAPLTYFVAVFYLILPGLLLNNLLIIETIFGSSDLSYKLSLISQILLGSLTMLEPLELLFLFLTAILLGINVALLIESITLLRREKSLTLALGGTGIVALVSTGCASCGISLLSILGISSSFLPFHGLSLYVFSSALLFISFVVIAKTNSKACKLK